jgi:hypothetical protein
MGHRRGSNTGISRTASMGSATGRSTASSTLHQRWVVRYRGFVLIPQNDLTWLVRPERSPMQQLPFRAPASSVDDVKALIDWRLDQIG